jgi:hypothetical protein
MVLSPAPVHCRIFFVIWGVDLDPFFKASLTARA